MSTEDINQEVKEEAIPKADESDVQNPAVETTDQQPKQKPVLKRSQKKEPIKIEEPAEVEPVDAPVLEPTQQRRTIKRSTLSIVVLILTAISFLIFQGYEHFIKDNVGPVIKVPDELIEAPVAVTEEELLQGVTAKDDRSGDVTKSLIVEKLSAIDSNKQRVITYVAIDDAMNVSRKTRTLQYTDYDYPTFSMKGSFLVPEGYTANLLDNITASSVLDGDLTNNVRYSIEGFLDLNTVGNYPIHLTVTDSAGGKSEFDTMVTVFDRTGGLITVNLVRYLLYLPVGAGFDPGSYFVSASNPNADVSITSNVDTSKPGTYNVDYKAETTNSVGYARMIVIVK